MLIKLPCMPLKEQFQCYTWHFSLQTGTVLAGWIGIVFSLLLLLQCLASLLNIVQLYPQENPPIIVAVFGFISLLVHGFLIYGARYENPLLMLPYLLFSLAFFAVLGGFIIYILLKSYVSEDPTISVALTSASAIFAALTFHIWVGIYSYYRELEDKLKPPPEFQLENMAFEKESESDLNSEIHMPLSKDSSFNHSISVSV